MQEQGLLDRQRRHERGKLPVSGLQGTVAVLTELAAELTHRAGDQSESSGNDGGGATALKQSEDALAQRLGERGRHGGSIKATRRGDGPIRKH